jgi:hypothetical protein
MQSNVPGPSRHRGQARGVVVVVPVLRRCVGREDVVVPVKRRLLRPRAVRSAVSSTVLSVKLSAVPGATPPRARRGRQPIRRVERRWQRMSVVHARLEECGPA